MTRMTKSQPKGKRGANAANLQSHMIMLQGSGDPFGLKLK